MAPTDLKLTIMHMPKQTWCNMASVDVECKDCCIVTFSESKQAMTRPFSTWQLREGWANLHSASDLEHVPLWNSRHTSRVSHLVSLPIVMLTAIRDAHKHWTVAGADGWKNVWRTSARVTNSDAKKIIPSKTDRKQKQKYSQFFPQWKMGSKSLWSMYFGGCLLVLPGKCGSWGFTGVR